MTFNPNAGRKVYASNNGRQWVARCTLCEDQGKIAGRAVRFHDKNEAVSWWEVHRKTTFHQDTYALFGQVREASALLGTSQPSDPGNKGPVCAPAPARDSAIPTADVVKRGIRVDLRCKLCGSSLLPPLAPSCPGDGPIYLPADGYRIEEVLNGPKHKAHGWKVQTVEGATGTTHTWTRCRGNQGACRNTPRYKDLTFRSNVLRAARAAGTPRGPVTLLI